MPRRPSARRVKGNRSYTVEEAAEIVGVTEQTIRTWIKRGLRALVERRPTLIRGVDLKDWIAAQRKSKSGPLPIGSFWCLGCKAPRLSAFGAADYHPISEMHGRLEAFCAACEAGCNRMVKVSSLPEWAACCEIGGNIPPHAYRDPATGT